MTTTTQAGCELDAQIAEKVFGWEGVGKPKDARPGDEQRYGVSPKDGLVHQIPDYSANIFPALLVVRKIREKRFDRFQLGCRKDGVFIAHFGPFEAEADTLPLAICLAALMSVGVVEVS